MIKYILKRIFFHHQNVGFSLVPFRVRWLEYFIRQVSADNLRAIERDRARYVLRAQTASSRDYPSLSSERGDRDRYYSDLRYRAPKDLSIGAIYESQGGCCWFTVLYSADARMPARERREKGGSQR